MERVSELKSEPIVGKKYLVNCVLLDGDWLPIIGEAHTDKELGVEALHYHYDVRFFSDSQINQHNRFDYLGDKGILGVTQLKLPNEQIQLKVKVCKHQMLEFPLFKTKTQWATFYAKYNGKKVNCNRCPHRNFDLSSLPLNEQGFKVCNGHGLRINTKTGQVEI